MSVRTHLGRVLQPGDSVLGYDLNVAALNENDLVGMKDKELPHAVLIRKHYPDRKKKKRAWKLKQMDVEEQEEAQDKKTIKKDAELAEQRAEDYERFLQELEEDREMRGQIDLYKDPEYNVAMQEDDDDDDAPPEVGLEELLDDMNLDDGEDV